MKYIRLKNIDYIVNREAICISVTNRIERNPNIHILANFLSPVVNVVGWVYDSKREYVILAYRERTEFCDVKRKEYIILEWISFFEKMINSFEQQEESFDATILSSGAVFFDHFNSFDPIQCLCYRSLEQLKVKLNISNENREILDPDEIVDFISNFNQDILPFDETEDEWFDCSEHSKFIEEHLKKFLWTFYDDITIYQNRKLYEIVCKSLMLASGLIWFGEHEIWEFLES